jgi:hypothetical protein
MSTMLEAPGVPFPLMPSANSSWSIDPASASLSIVAAPHSDLFLDPRSASQVTAEAALDAATLLGSPPAGDFPASRASDGRLRVDLRRRCAASLDRRTARRSWLHRPR